MSESSAAKQSRFRTASTHQQAYQRLKNAGWILVFIGLCAVWGYAVMNASRQSRLHKDTGNWICPILGSCGPAGTPGLGRW